MSPAGVKVRRIWSHSEWFFPQIKKVQKHRCDPATPLTDRGKGLAGKSWPPIWLAHSRGEPISLPGLPEALIPSSAQRRPSTSELTSEFHSCHRWPSQIGPGTWIPYPRLASNIHATRPPFKHPVLAQASPSRTVEEDSSLAERVAVVTSFTVIPGGLPCIH